FAGVREPVHPDYASYKQRRKDFTDDTGPIQSWILRTRRIDLPLRTTDKEFAGSEFIGNPGEAGQKSYSNEPEHDSGHFRPSAPCGARCAFRTWGPGKWRPRRCRACEPGRGEAGRCPPALRLRR